MYKSMQYKFFLFWLLATATFFAGCTDAPEYPLEPVITFDGLNKNRIAQFTNGPLDSLILTFSFTDGDGNLSQLDSDSADIFLVDSRLNTPYFLRFPLIEEEGTGSGISGTASVTISNVGFQLCCIYRQRACAAEEEYPIDTFSFSLQIQDREGNLSNKIKTDLIEIQCVQ